MKKFKLNWKTVAAAVVLSVVLVVFIGSQIAEAQVEPTGAGVPTKRVLQRAATTEDVYNSLVALDEQLNRIEQKINALTEQQHQILKIVRVLDREVVKK